MLTERDIHSEDKQRLNRYMYKCIYLLVTLRYLLEI